ncbi:CD59 glycoprotein [Chanos chanos]|uniref:CD59 glycoprotein n=1 Tax=Chanos chanos TaxID=29144 RepID=A0A6J2VGR7_CHACN|nr:CD59 glycoprotein-like [Chanos chanos]
MRCSSGLFVIVCSLTFGLSLALRCHKCSDYHGGLCENVQECSYEDSCLSLYEKGGKTIRRCIRYTDCDNSRLSQMFPSVSGFTYRCCSTNLCNSSVMTAVSKPFLPLLGSLVGLWWCWWCTL